MSQKKPQDCFCAFQSDKSYVSFTDRHQRRIKIQLETALNNFNQKIRSNGLALELVKICFIEDQ